MEKITNNSDQESPKHREEKPEKEMSNLYQTPQSQLQDPSSSTNEHTSTINPSPPPPPTGFENPNNADHETKPVLDIIPTQPPDNNNNNVPNPENPVNGSENPGNPVNGAENPLQVLDENGVDQYFRTMPPGCRFRPSDLELLVHYLKRRIEKKPLPPNKIHNVNLYHSPPEYFARTLDNYGEREWYLFTPRDKKYANGNRPCRSAGDGFWKATGADKEIKHNNRVVGRKKTLVFYRGKQPTVGEKYDSYKTKWVMNEYKLGAKDPPAPKPRVTDDPKYNHMRLDDHILCRLYKQRSKKRPKPDSDEEVEAETPPSAGSNYYHGECSNSKPSGMQEPVAECSNPLTEIPSRRQRRQGYFYQAEMQPHPVQIGQRYYLAPLDPSHERLDNPAAFTQYFAATQAMDQPQMDGELHQQQHHPSAGLMNGHSLQINGESQQQQSSADFMNGHLQQQMNGEWQQQQLSVGFMNEHSQQMNGESQQVLPRFMNGPARQLQHPHQWMNRVQQPPPRPDFMPQQMNGIPSYMYGALRQNQQPSQGMMNGGSQQQQQQQPPSGYMNGEHGSSSNYHK